MMTTTASAPPPALLTQRELDLETARLDKVTVVSLNDLLPPELRCYKGTLKHNLGIGSTKNKTLASRIRNISTQALTASNITKFEHQRAVVACVKRVLRDIDDRRSLQRAEEAERARQEAEEAAAMLLLTQSNATMGGGGLGLGGFFDLDEVNRVALARRSSSGDETPKRPMSQGGKQECEATTARALETVMSHKEALERSKETIAALRSNSTPPHAPSASSSSSYTASSNIPIVEPCHSSKFESFAEPSSALVSAFSAF